MRRLKLIPILLTMHGFALGCGTDPTKSDAILYQFALLGTRTDSTTDRIRDFFCAIDGHFDVPSSQSSGTVQFPVRVVRILSERSGTHNEQTSADTTISAAVMDYAGLGSDSLRFTFGAASYTVALGPAAGLGGEYSGPWTCGPDVPLAQDSTLNAYGYDANEVLEGTWQITEERPIG
jgi:hypothetical protein